MSAGLRSPTVRIGFGIALVVLSAGDSVGASPGYTRDAVQSHQREVGRGDLLDLQRRMKDTLELVTRQERIVSAGSAVLGLTILFAVYSYQQREIGRRQRSESRLIHLNRLYAVLSRANRAIVQARTRDELFREICRVSERPHGILGVYASQPGFFDGETLRLLEEVTSDVSFALHALDEEEQRRNAETEIRRLNQGLEGRVLERTTQLAGANGRLATQSEELARASRMKNEFLARMSHEFRTPLNSIIGFTDLLTEQGEGPIGETYVDYVRHVHHGAHHLLALVDEVLDLSRIEDGRIDLRHEEFAAAEAVSEVLAVIRPLAEARKLDLRSEVSPALVAYGDRTRFKQILYNLLSNAVKFTPAGGSLQVTAESDYGEIRVCVSDTGIGLPPGRHAAIFEEFTQVGPPTSGVKEGAGLGLTITKRIVELHGGRIWLESAPGEGSRFFFTMPAARAGEHALKQRWSSTA
jgi:signal transduction histidine kinase